MWFVRAVTTLSFACLLPAAEARAAGEREGVLNQLVSAEQNVRQAPDSEAARTTLASLYLKLKQNRNAVATMQDFLRRHPDSSGVLRLAATAFLLQEDYAAARDYAVRALKAGPREAKAVYVLAMAKLGLQDTAGAETLLKESTKLDPNILESNFQLGLLYTRSGTKLAEAIALLEKAKTISPELAGVHTALGSALLQANRANEAVQALTTATRLDPLSTESWYLMADAYRRAGDELNAKAALQTFHSRNAEVAERRAREMRSRSHYDQGVHLLSNTDELDKANQYFSKAVAELPDLDAGYYRMAQVHFLKKDLAGALRQVREAIQRNPFEPEYYYVEAKCLEPVDSAAALSSIRKAVALRPDVPDFENLLQALRKTTNRKTTNQ